MKVLQIGIYAAVLVALSGCSTLASDGKRIDYGAAAQQVPPLELPPDLTEPGVDERYQIPQGEGGSVATYSSYSKGGTPSQAVSAILPGVPGVHMEHDNAQRWLVVDDKAENVWPVVKAFWEEMGLSIDSEDPAAGVMKTNWAANRATSRLNGTHNGFDHGFNYAYMEGDRDQYVTRLERSKDGASTGIYITHRGIREVYSENKGTSHWVARARDPELEAIMLQKLMEYFGVSQTKAAGEMAAVSSVTAAGPATAALSTPEPAGLASLREVSPGVIAVVVNDPFDRAWRKVGLALDSAALAVEDKDREKGIYFLQPVRLETSWLDKLEFWKSDVDTTRHYRVNVKDDGATCEVSVVDQNGSSNKVSKQLLEAIYKNINQQQ